MIGLRRLLYTRWSLGELEAGFARSDDPVVARNDALDVLSAIAVMPFDAGAARAFGAYRPRRPLGGALTIVR